MAPTHLILIGDMNIHLKRTGDCLESNNNDLNKIELLNITSLLNMVLVNETFAFKKQTFKRSQNCSVLDLVWCSKNLLKDITYLHILPMPNEWKEHCTLLLSLNISIEKLDCSTDKQLIIARHDKQWNNELQTKLDKNLNHVHREWNHIIKFLDNNRNDPTKCQNILDAFTTIMISILWKCQIQTWGLKTATDKKFRNKELNYQDLKNKMKDLKNNCSLKNIIAITSSLFNKNNKETMTLDNDKWSPTVLIVQQKYEEIFDNSSSNFFNNDFLRSKQIENNLFNMRTRRFISTAEEIKSQLQEIQECTPNNLKAAAGLDMIYQSNLGCAPAGTSSIENMIHEIMLRTGKYPTQAKISRLVPIPKVKGASLCNNNIRPISITTSLLKKFDVWMTNNLYQAKTNDTGFSEFSFGFQKIKACATT
jgi:hypothetical protein